MERGSIIHLTSVHSALDVRIFQKECRSLARCGYAVTLMAPNTADFTLDGVAVIGVRIPRSRPLRMTLGVLRVLFRAIRSSGALYHFHDPELIPAGLVLRALGKRVVFDLHEDLHDDIQEKLYIPACIRGSIARGAAALGAWSAARFSGVVAATPGIAGRFEHLGRGAQLLYNFPTREAIADRSESPWSKRAAAVAYVGGIEPGRGIREMVRALELLQTGAPTLELAGPFSSRSLLEEMQRQAGWSRVHYTPWLNREAARACLGRVQAGIHVPHPLPKFLGSYPNKIFEYMAAGIPLIASDFPHWRSVIDRNGCGICVDPMSPKSIADAIQYILAHPREAEEMGERGRLAVERSYNWETEEQKLVQFYRQILDDACVA